MATSRVLVKEQTAVYHCISRTVLGEKIIDSRGKEVLRKQMWRQAGFCGVEVLTYCLLSNHLHILVRVPYDEEIRDVELMRRYRILYGRGRLPMSAMAPEVLAEMLALGGREAEALRERLKSRMGEVSVFMKELKQRFSIWFNRTYGSHGTLWSERFKSLLVENSPEALKMVAAYIDLNPVRAGLCGDPKSYRWSGYAEALSGEEQAQRGLEWIMGEDDWAEALRGYRTVVFGTGYHGKDREGARIDPQKVKEVLQSGGKVSIQELLRCRVRYFTDGAILGTREYIQSWYEENREWLGKRRKEGPKRMRGSEWGELAVLRDLRSEVFG